jgi:predicted dithiol-disulfide oxidoreductase (DUF899 family)
MNNSHQAPVVMLAEWEAARLRLLAKEKDLTRTRDALAADRRRMPWLKVDQEYLFDGPNGTAHLPDLFEGRRQLLLYRAFFEPGVSGWPDHACVGCSLMGWSIPWFTITDSFDADCGVADWYGTNAFIRDGDSVYRTYFISDSPDGYPQVRRFSWLNRHDEYGPTETSATGSADHAHCD